MLYKRLSTIIVIAIVVVILLIGAGEEGILVSQRVPVAQRATVGISTQCQYDDECALMDSALDYRSCWPGACVEVDYSSEKFVAVNKTAFEQFRQEEERFRPSNCGPPPGCPVSFKPTNFFARCIENICLKIQQQTNDNFSPVCGNGVCEQCESTCCNAPCQQDQNGTESCPPPTCLGWCPQDCGG